MIVAHFDWVRANDEIAIDLISNFQWQGGEAWLAPDWFCCGVKDVEMLGQLAEGIFLLLGEDILWSGKKHGQVLNFYQYRHGE